MYLGKRQQQCKMASTTTATSRETTEIICVSAQFVGKCRQINLQLMNSKSDRERETESETNVGMEGGRMERD